MKKRKIIIYAVLLSVILSCNTTQNNKDTSDQRLVKEVVGKERKEVLNFYKKIKENDSLPIFKRIELLKEISKKTEQIKYDSLELKILNYKAVLYKKEEKYDKAIKIAKELLNTAQKYNEINVVGEAYYKLGLYNNKQNQKDSAYYYYKKSLEVYKKVNDSLKIGRRLLNLAIIESSFNDYIKSNKTSVEALKYLGDKNNKYKASVYNNLGINSRKQKLFNKAIEYYNQAIKLSKKEKNILIYENNIANLYGDEKKYKKAISILESLLINPKIQKYLKVKAQIIDNLAYKNWLQDSTKNILSDLSKAEKIRIKEKDNYGLIASYAHLSDYYKNLDKKQSLEYAYKMLEISNKERSINDIIEAYDKIKDIEKPLIALKISNKRSKLKDSLELAKDRAQDKYALIKYENEENEKKAIASENRAIKSEKKAIEHKQEKQLWAFLGSLSLLTLVSYFFYKRQKTKKEKIIEVYKTETRLAKKIHDELANDLYLTMDKLQSNENISKSELLTDLDKIYKQTRDISHENSQVITGEGFQGFLQQLFIDFTKDNCKIMSKDLTEMQVNTLTKEKQIVLYRVLQELLVNMRKHSKANLVIIAFEEEKDKLLVRYKDNGIGTQLITNKNGLQNMETRIKSVGGTITFDSEKQKGFQAKFQFKK